MTDAIAVHVPSDTTRLREVVVGPVKTFDWDDLAAGSPPDEVSRRQAQHNRVGIPTYDVAAAQHEAFVQVLLDEGVVVHHVDEADVTIQVYPRDIGFVIDDTFFLARSRLEVRRHERAGLRSLLPRLSRVRELDAGIIEGGDVIVDDIDVLVGLGEETDPDGIDALRRTLGEEGSSRRIVALEFSHGGIVHLDTKFTLVGPGVGVFLPSAFTDPSRRELEQRYDLIEASLDEALSLDLNTLALGPQRVVVNERNERIAKEVQTRGITPVPVDYSEITKFPGGFRCATLPLVRRP